MKKNRAFFTHGLRTPFGRAQKGAYAETRPDDLLVSLLTYQKQNNPSLWSTGAEDLLVGCAYPEGEQGYNVARMASLGAGLNCPGVTINRLCASSLEAATVAAARIHAGWGNQFLVAGIESMTKIARGGASRTNSDAITSASPQAYITMGETAEEVCARYPLITRARQQEFAARSHELADRAYQNNLYASQIAPIKINKDEFIRFPVDKDKMNSLPPAFKENGIVTAATSSPLTDGATSGWVLSDSAMKAHGISHALEILDVTWSHVAPEVMGLGPIPAIKALLKNNNLSIKDIQAFELNEAFAVQVLACIDELNIATDTINAWGGALALGHPLGASGLRLLSTLHDRLKFEHKEQSLGIASLCVGGGQGMAVLCRYSSV